LASWRIAPWQCLATTGRVWASRLGRIGKVADFQVDQLAVPFEEGGGQLFLVGAQRNRRNPVLSGAYTRPGRVVLAIGADVGFDQSSPG